MKSIVEKYGGWSLLTIVFACLLIGLETVSFFVNGLSDTYGHLLLLKSLPCLCVFLISATAYHCFPKVTERVFVLVLASLLIYESVLGVLQLAGLKMSSHYLYSITGSFRNPGPYGGFVAVCLSVCVPAFVRYCQNVCKIDKFLGWFCALASLAGFMVLPASQSRTAWAALLVALTFFLCGRAPVRDYARRHRWIVIAVAMVVTVCAVSAFFMKKDSALGRLHIWKIETRAIASAPLIGSGPGMSMGSYGAAQADYFESGQRSESDIRAASCPEYAFNEYLKCGIEAGVAGLLAAVGVIVAAFFALQHCGSLLCWAVLCWGVFAFGSYPSSVPQLVLILSALVGCASVSCVWKGIPNDCRTADCVAALSADEAQMSKAEMFSFKILRIYKISKISTATAIVVISVVIGGLWIARNRSLEAAERRWKTEMKFSDMTAPSKRADALATVYDYLCDNPEFLFDLGYSLFMSCEYDEAIPVLRDGSRISSDPMFVNIIGRCYEKLGDYDAAESSYIKASMMVPSRLYPFVLLMDMYESIGEFEKSEAAAERVLSMPYDPDNRNEKELRRRAEDTLSRKRTVTGNPNL